MFFVLRHYKRATPQLALVRTGAGGTKIVRNGGVIALPHLHDVTWVNMAAMEVRINCRGREALPFEDGELECQVDLVLRVAPPAEAVLTAASMWGEKTRDVAQWQPLIEAQLLDAVRAAAAQTTLAAAHEDRGTFIRQTQAELNHLLLNVLLIESGAIRVAGRATNSRRKPPQGVRRKRSSRKTTNGKLSH